MIGRTHYQYYTNVNYKTCEDCLNWHGVIRARQSSLPVPSDACESAVLPIPWRQLRAYRKKAKRMKQRARGELARRRLFDQAVDLMASDFSAASELLDRAARIDLYIPDLERLAKEQEDWLATRSAEREALRGQFVKAYSDKFGWRRYERLPEVMRLSREEAGIQRINELFGS